MPKLRLGWYAGASTALAGSVVVSAFHQRPNFYSAMVYLAQSNFCLIVLVNFTLLLYSSFLFGLIRLCFGRLRTIEVEVLTERAWFAITETCLAMTIFREEMGAWFLVMFTTLISGKVWGWIVDGRVEVLEQQPPANTRLFHTRLSISLAVSFLYDVLLLRYAVHCVIDQGRPTMMIMFLFEFAVLTTISWRSILRYLLSVFEQRVIKTQTRKRLAERRLEVRQQREAMIRARDQGEASEAEREEPLPDENDIEEFDIEVPGWAAKGEWVLWLDLITDMFKLGIYVAFFFMLLRFYGLPIQIIRDLFLTTRDFLKRLSALLRYRKAIEKLNRFPDATEAELARENTCIICREEMHPWDQRRNPGAIDRVRPKRLPCEHILHLGCLKSWLERQQVCPTCRTPVTGPRSRRRTNRPAAGQGPPVQGQPPPTAAAVAGDNHANGPPQGQGNNALPVADQGQQGDQPRDAGPRVFSLGPFRVGLANNQRQFNQLLQPAAPAAQQTQASNAGVPTVSPNQQLPPQPPANNIASASAMLDQAAQDLMRQFADMAGTMQHIQHIRLLLAEIQRMRLLHLQLQQGRQHQQNGTAPAQAAGVTPQVPMPMPPTGSGVPPAYAPGYVPQMPPPLQPLPTQLGLQSLPYLAPLRVDETSLLSRFGTASPPIPAGSSDLPEGVVIPPGWSLMPLQRVEGATTHPPSPHLPFPTNTSEAALNTPGVQQPSSMPGSEAHSNVRLPPMTVLSQPRPTPTTTQTPSNPVAQTSQGAVENETQIAAPGATQPPSAPPTWGGSAQLFPTSTHTTTHNNEQSSNAPPPPSIQSPSPASQVTPAVPAVSASTADPASPPTFEEQTAGSVEKRKGRAATVEEASDEEGEA